MKTTIFAIALSFVTLFAVAQNSKPAADTSKTKNVKKTSTKVKKESSSTTTK